MILLALALAADYQPHPREHPQSAITWLDHYDYCLEANHAAVLKEKRENGDQWAAKRAVIRCWPVEAGVRGRIVDELSNNHEKNAAERHDIANRLIWMVATAFATRHNMKVSDLGPLSPEN
ncbi:MAG: hypothetical protein ACO1O3_13240 [Sphingobium sp.]